MPIDPYKSASDEINKLVIEENIRLNHEIRKIERDIIVAYLNDVIKDKLAKKKSMPALYGEVQSIMLVKELEDDIAIIKNVIKKLNGIKKIEKAYFGDLAHNAALLKDAHIQEIDDKIAANSSTAVYDVFESKCSYNNPELKLLNNKISVTLAIEEISHNNKDQNLLQALKDISVKDNQGKPIDAFAIMNERRGKTPDSFWGLIDKILAKVGLKAPVIGVKSAQFMNKMGQTLFSVRKEDKKPPKPDRDNDVDDKIKPARKS